MGFVGSEGLLHLVGVGHGLEIPFCQSWVSPRILRAQDMQDTGYRAHSLPGFLGSFTKASCKASKNRAGGGGKEEEEAEERDEEEEEGSGMVEEQEMIVMVKLSPVFTVQDTCGALASAHFSSPTSTPSWGRDT